MITIQLSDRQKKIIDIVKNNEPITSESIANELNLTRATLRPDLAILTMSGILDARPKVGYFYSGKSNFNLFRDKVTSIKVSEIKSIPVIVDEETSVYDSIVNMFLEDVGTIFVITEGLLSGVVSRKDFLKSAIGGMDINKIPVGIIMTRMPNIVVCTQEETVLDAAIKLIEHEVDSLPVVEEVDIDNRKGYKVLGRISKTNITSLFVDFGVKG
ncbi:helix-turn-helix transcriptional regulator [Clostridiisalibacter paucivorans]|uniref:helix-turn-helix transcriptional regulator n=1 Tax=Clostridiisalibacter paucivorans TaxID=408753 RepID=UPI000479ED25|nr:helix-turn-helix transcriptional regulator [Clostridiisalibacter paucivorans]